MLFPLWSYLEKMNFLYFEKYLEYLEKINENFITIKR